MLGRSKNNESAALLLLGQNYYDNSVVSFYYSVLQRMMYALKNSDKRPIPYDQQNPLNEDIHFKILAEIRNRITNTREEQAFSESFNRLFEYRKKADYSSESITMDECVECRSLHEGLMKKLDRFFPVKNV